MIALLFIEPRSQQNEDPQRREKFVEREKFLTLSIPLVRSFSPSLFSAPLCAEYAS